MINEVAKVARASALKNKEFICIETFSGYGSSMQDPKGSQHLLSPDADDSELGAAALDALGRSRFVLPEEDSDLFDYKLKAERYAAWVEKLIVAFGYGTKYELFKNMISCDLESKNGLITLFPTNHDELEGWSGDGISKEDYVVISANSSAEEVGAALRVGFSRCK